VQAFSSEVTHLSLELADFDGFDYRPGQYMNVQLDDGTHRSFSMASLPNAGRLDFHVRRIPGGLFTTHRLAQLRVGERLRVELPLGEFQLDKAAYRPLVMVATGTGIAPIKSLLESLLDDADCPPVWLYWGMRTEEDLYLRDEILSWSHRLYEFQFVPVLSRASLGWSGRRGHVQHAVIEDLPELSEHAIYLCGSPTMISEAKTIFLAHGAPIEHIHADGFSFQHAHNRLPTLPSTPALEPAIHLT
jgi:CDP-4-dehydro-6-deoxyglucose reductase